MRNILVVDDSHFVRLAFSYALEGTDYVVHAAGSGREAVDRAARDGFDMIFLDLKMPEMDGVETLRALNPLIGSTPVYIVTAYRDEFMKRLKEAADDGLRFEVAEKPLDGDEIRAIVQATLEGPYKAEF